MRRSARRDKAGKNHYKGDAMFKQFKNYGYWFKRFGIYIKNNAMGMETVHLIALFFLNRKLTTAGFYGVRIEV